MNKTRYRSLSVITAIIILILWFIATDILNISELIFPSPKSVLNGFIEIFTEGYKGFSIWKHLADSLKRIFEAFFLAAIIFVPLGLLCGYNEKLRAIMEPVITFIRPLPPLAYYSIIVLWMGIGDSSKVMLLFIAAAPPIYISCVDGIMKINKNYIFAAKTLGANNRQIFFKVMFWAALPDIFTGLRNSIAGAYGTLVAAEMVAAMSGVGWMALDASKYLRSDIIFVAIIIMGITGLFLDEGLKFVDKKIIYWKGKE